jgi:Zn-dependent M32 family carboxypeptidase
MAVFDVGISIFHFCVGDQLWGVAWTLAAIVWFLMSFINYNEERIKLLEKKADKYDALCELVEELRKANEVDRDIDAQQDRRIKRLEDRLR